MHKTQQNPSRGLIIDLYLVPPLPSLHRKIAFGSRVCGTLAYSYALPCLRYGRAMKYFLFGQRVYIFPQGMISCITPRLKVESSFGVAAPACSLNVIPWIPLREGPVVTRVRTRGPWE